MKFDKSLSLVFSFYLSEDFNTNIANRMHFYCLSKYRNLFKDALFVILIDDVDNVSLIGEFEKKIIDCGYVSNTQFIIEQNNPLREAYVFKNYLVDKLKDYSCPVLFSHNKGYTNVLDPEITDKKNILMWISALYFSSLYYLDECFKGMFNDFTRSLFFGGFMTRENSAESVHDYCPTFNGSIYLINPGNVLEYMYDNNIEPLPLGNRWYAEHFPRMIINETNPDILNKAFSHEFRTFNFFEHRTLYYGEYGGITKLMRYALDNDFDEFNKQFEESLESIGFYKNN